MRLFESKDIQPSFRLPIEIYLFKRSRKCSVPGACNFSEGRALS
jgi:hypothetical protein